MQIVETKQYLRTKKKILKQFILKEEEIETTIKLFQENPYNPSLHYKKMVCKKDKNRYSIRILNTAILACICDHDEYNMRNKGC